jgi:hypothetical protein
VSIIFEVDNIIATTLTKSQCSSFYVLDDDNFNFYIRRDVDKMTDYETLAYNNMRVDDSADKPLN